MRRSIWSETVITPIDSTVAGGGEVASILAYASTARPSLGLFNSKPSTHTLPLSLSPIEVWLEPQMQAQHAHRSEPSRKDGWTAHCTWARR